MDLMCYRYPDLQYEYDIDPDFGGMQVPNFILQPLVENSLLHGLKNNGYRGKVVISVKKNLKGMEIAIRDNGGIAGRRLFLISNLFYYSRERGKRQ